MDLHRDDAGRHQPVASVTPDSELVPGQTASLPVQVTGYTGTLAYTLQAYSNYLNCADQGQQWRNQGTGFGSCTGTTYNFDPPSGLTFASGAFGGKAGTTLTPNNATYTPVAYRVIVTESRVITQTDGSTSTQQNVVTSNQVKFRLRTGAAPAATIDYGSALRAKVGDTVSWAPTVTGGTASAHAVAFQQQSLGAVGTGERNATALPSGLSLVNGAITGTVQAGTVTDNVSNVTGTYRGISICATIAGAKTCDVEVPIQIVDRDPVTIVTPAYPSGTVGQVFKILPVVGGPFTGPLTFTPQYLQTTSPDDASGDRVLSSDPPGLRFTTDGGLSGLLSLAGTYRGYKIKVTDASGYSATSPEIVVRISPQDALTLTAPSVVDISENTPMASLSPRPAGLVGTLVWGDLQGIPSGDTAGTAQQTTTEIVGSLPGNVSWSKANGSFTGSPSIGTGGKTYRGLRACAKDDRGKVACTGEISFRVAAFQAAALTVPAPSNGTAYVAIQNVDMSEIRASPSGIVGTFGFAASASTGQTTGTTVAGSEFVQGSLPSGLSYEQATGRIYGKATATPGRYRGYAICGTDTGRAGTICTGEIVIDVQAPPAFTLTMPTIIDAKSGTLLADVAPQPFGQVGSVTYQTAPTFNGSTAVSNSANGDVQQGSLPAGLAYRGTATGAVGGTPASPGANPVRYRGYKVCGTDQASPPRTSCSNEFTFTVRP